MCVREEGMLTRVMFAHNKSGTPYQNRSQQPETVEAIHKKGPHQQLRTTSCVYGGHPVPVAGRWPDDASAATLCCWQVA
jgi:hypothetical protein